MSKINPSPAAIRGEPLRQRVLAAAETLLRVGKTDFSMRDLASEAGVSFATPFNQFGGKAAIMQALSARRIDIMLARFAMETPPPDALGRVLLAVDTAAAVMLDEPGVNRVVMGWIGSASQAPGRTLQHSAALWSLALGEGEGLSAVRREEGLRRLPEQLALAFRGTLSFWTAGELPDEALAPTAREMAQALLAGYGAQPTRDRHS